MAKHPIPTWATDAVIGDEEKEKKQKNEEKERNKTGPQPYYPGPFK